MKRYLFIILGLIVCFSLNKEAFAFGIEPARIELSIPAGRQKGATVVINNSGSSEPLHLKVYVQDIMFLPDGTNEFLSAGSTEWSCAQWIKVIPEEIDIPAGKTQSVRLSVSVPIQAKGGYYTMLFFESTPTYTEGLGINFRLGALVDVSITNTGIRQAKLTHLSFVKPKQIEVGIFNEGNILIRPKGKIKIFNLQGKKVRQLDFNTQNVGILPKTLRKFYVEIGESLEKGKYNIKAEIDYGTRYLLIGELAIEL